MKHKYDLTEAEIQYLLGESHSHKLKDILRFNKLEKVKPIKEETTSSDEKEGKKEKLEKIQQNLLDF